MGRLGSGPRIVGRKWSEIRVSASFYFSPREGYRYLRGIFSSGLSWGMFRGGGVISWNENDYRSSDQANRLGLRVRLYSAIVYIHHRQLLLLSPKTGIHCTDRPTEDRRLSRPVPFSQK